MAVETDAAVVTGVSSGIGRAIARDLLRHGWTVFGSVRRASDADALSEALGSQFRPLLFDVTDEAAIARAAEQTEEALQGRVLRALVNNAGMTNGGPLLHQPMSEILEILHVNGASAVAVSQAFAPLLGARSGFRGRSGRIVNVSSVGGRIVTPFAAAYQAGKHALEAYSDGLRRELSLFGIDVVVVQPGAIRTEIWAKTEALALADRYADTPFAEPIRRFEAAALALGRSGFPPERIARVVRHALTARRPRTRYAVVPNRLLNWSLPLSLSDRTLDGLMASRFGLTPQSSH